MMCYLTSSFAGSRGPGQWLAELVQRAVRCTAVMQATSSTQCVSSVCEYSNPELVKINWYRDVLHVTPGFGQPERTDWDSDSPSKTSVFFYIRDCIYQMAHRQLPGKPSKNMSTTSRYLQRTFCHWSHTCKFHGSQIKDTHHSENPTELVI